MPDELTERQKNRISKALASAWYLMAGDPVTYVDPNGVATDLLCIAEDIEIFRAGEGVEVNRAGIISRGLRELDFLIPYLKAKSIILDPAGYFLIDDPLSGQRLRWEFAEKGIPKDKLVPIAGIQNQTTVRIRTATELNQTEPGSEWGADLAN